MKVFVEYAEVTTCLMHGLARLKEIELRQKTASGSKKEAQGALAIPKIGRASKEGNQPHALGSMPLATTIVLFLIGILRSIFGSC